MRRKQCYKIGRETGRGFCFLNGEADYSFNVVIKGRKLEVTMIQNRDGKFLEPEFWKRDTHVKVRIAQGITNRIKCELYSRIKGIPVRVQIS